ncbi:MAG TPA: M36 family metallopeptidase, partial [Kofleriaceae bacterium]|nr:M36 family metallopeptidase [Kofleriaceae bacterium]
MLGLRPDLADLVLDREVNDIGGTTLRYHQVVDGVRVFEGELVAGLDPAGALVEVRSDYEPAASALATRPAVDAGQALRAAAAELGAPIPTAPPPELVIVRGDKRAPGLHLAWEVVADVRSPRGDWLVFVDAGSGAIDRAIDMLRAAGADCTPCNAASDPGCGRVFHENPVDLTDDTSLRDTSNVDADQVGCLLGNLTSATDLTGTYVNTSITNTPRATPPYDYARSVNEPFADEVNVYYHLNRSHGRLVALGFPGVMSYSINTDAHDPTLGDNAHYVPSGQYLEFGIGGVDDASDGDVPYHEYGHAIQDNQVPGYGTLEEGGAAGEGFGDYWSGAITETSSVPALGNACIASWDSTAYLPYTGAPGTGCLRRLDGTKQYPRDLDFEVHDDGEMWSAALWRLRATLGGDTTDALVIKSHTFLTSSAKFINLADAVVSADAALNGGANAAAIGAAFAAQGIPRTGTADAASGTVSNAAFSCGVTNYANLSYKECRYTQPGATWMRFHFSAFNTEAGFDVARISDGSFRQVQELSGSLGASSTLAVTGDTIVLRFKADTSVHKPGFTVDRVDFHQGCTSDAQCSDGDACNGVETCAAGVCSAGTAPDCDDGNVCTTDSCAPASGCAHAPVADGTSCVDATVCNGTETCQSGVCTAGAPPTCDDGNVCTSDTCDAVTGCATTPVLDGTPCGDGNVCNGGETCEAGGCAAGTPLNCDDGDPCTADSCDAVTGCAHTPVSCTGPATCAYDGT